jgi:ribosomal protein L35
MHFGKGYGPKTPEGMLRRAQANLKHGLRSNAAMEERRMMKKMMQWREDLDNV